MFEICSDVSKTGLKIYYFVNIRKRPKNGQMAKPFYFWQKVSKKAKWQPCWVGNNANTVKLGEV